MSSALRLSVGANVALIGIVAALLWRDQAAPPPVAPPAGPVSARAGAPEPRAEAEGPRADSPGAELDPAAIAQFESMGISREVLVNVVLGEFHRRWDTRF